MGAYMIVLFLSVRAKTTKQNLREKVLVLNMILNISKIRANFKYESKNYRTKLAHFVVKVNYSANWQSNLKHCHTSTATRCILLPWPSTFIPEYKMRSGILYLKPLYWGLPNIQGYNPSFYRPFRFSFLLFTVCRCIGGCSPWLYLFYHGCNRSKRHTKAREGKWGEVRR